MIWKWLLYGNLKRYVSAASLSLAEVVCSHTCSGLLAFPSMERRQKISEVTLSARILGVLQHFLWSQLIVSYMDNIYLSRWSPNVPTDLKQFILLLLIVVDLIWEHIVVVWPGGVTVWLFAFQLMIFGFFLCVDAFLYVFTLLPLRVLLAVLRLLTLPCCGFRSEPKHTLSNL